MALTVAHTTSTAKANNPAYDISANAWNGTAAHTVAFTSGSLTGTGETVTSSTPVLDLTQTWNNAAAGFTGIKLNITNTSSLATSAYLVDLQVGGTSRFKVDAGGRAILSPTGWQDPFGFGSLLEVDSLSSAGSVQINRWDAGAGPPRTVFTKSRGAAIGTAGALLSGDQIFELVGYGYDAGPALQESVVIQAAVDAAPTVGSIPGRIIFSTAASGSGTPTERLRIDSTGTLSFSSGTTATAIRAYNTVDSVTTPTNYERGVFDWTTSPNVLTIGTQKGGTGVTRNVQFISGGAGFMDWSITQASILSITGAAGFGAFLTANNASGAGFGAMITGSTNTDVGMEIDVAGAPYLFFGSGSAVADLHVNRQGIGTLGIQHSTKTSPAALQVYNTSDTIDTAPSANYERATFDWRTTSNILRIGTEKGGTGSSRNIQFIIGGAVTDNLGVTPATKTTNYSVADADKYLIFNGSGSITLTLQAASSYPGRQIYVKTIAAFTVVSASSNVVPATSATAGTAILAATAGKWALLVSDGTNWNIMAAN